jgi:hypothetical protein
MIKNFANVIRLGVFGTGNPLDINGNTPLTIVKSKESCYFD